MRSDLAIATNGSAAVNTIKGGAVSPLRGEVARVVTTSWDDGDPFDLEIGRVLAERKVTGTFYIPIQGHHNNGRIERAEILTLDSGGFEIGAHGISHPNLPRCEPRQLVVEVEGSKKRLEDDLGKAVKMFAYPNGRHSSRVIAAVKQARFDGARTTEMLACGLAFDPFSMPTSIQVYPHSRLDYVRNLARAADFSRAWGYVTRVWPGSNWVKLAMHLFDRVLARGGVWHLYGHSWEVQEHGLLNALGVVLDYVSNRPGVSYLSNGELARMSPVLSAEPLVCGEGRPL